MATLTEIEFARNAAQRIRPAGIMAYPDMVTVWLKTPLRHSDRNRLNAQCSGGLHVSWHPMKSDHNYQQRLQLRQPTAEALHSLAHLDDVLINQLELALDWTFDHERQRDRADAFVSQYHVKRWHGKQEITFFKSTRYTGPPRAPNNFVSYADKPCRLTGEVFCLHLEWRIKGVPALRRAGITTVRELLSLDLHQFWQDRLILRAVDHRALGRQHNRLPTDQQMIQLSADNASLPYDLDTIAGARLVQHCGSTQAVVDQYRKSLNVGRCLVPIEVPQLLPRPSYDLYRQTNIKCQHRSFSGQLHPTRLGPATATEKQQSKKPTMGNNTTITIHNNINPSPSNNTTASPRNNTTAKVPSDTTIHIGHEHHPTAKPAKSLKPVLRLPK
jgi:hypothetical protein